LKLQWRMGYWNYLSPFNLKANQKQFQSS